MRVLFVHNRYQEYGGEDAVFDLERKALTERGVEVSVYSRHNDEIKAFHTGQKAFLPAQAIHSSRTVSDIESVVRTTRPDVAYVHNIYPLISPSVYRALASAGVPSIQVAHNFRPYCMNGLLYRQGAVCEECLGHGAWAGVRNRCFRGSLGLSVMYAGATTRARTAPVDAIVCPTPFTARKLVQAGVPAKSLCVRPHFIAETAAEPTPGSGRYALYLGRLTPEKGLNTLIEAFARTPSVELVIAGTGPLEQDLRLQIATRGLSNITMTGFVSGEAKRALLDDATFLIIPSEWYEVFGTVALEAFRAGKPVVASRIGGLPFVVNDGHTGRLFEPGDAGSLAACVTQLSANPTMRETMGRAALTAVHREFSADRWFDTTMELFRRVTFRAQESPVFPAAIAATSGSPE